MSQLSERLVSAYGFFLLRRMSVRLAAFAVLIGVSLFSTVIIVENRLANSVARLPLQVGSLEQSIGYGGLIHHFKNYVLRPGEAAYAVEARQAAKVALQLLDSLEADLAPFAIDAELLHVRQAVWQYNAHIDEVADMHASGATPQEIDAAVRFDDSEALRDVTLLRARVEEAVIGRLKHMQWLSVATFMLSLAGGGVLLLAVLHEHRKTKDAVSATEAGLVREREVNEELRSFAYAMSHDLKSPMNTVYMLLEEIRGGPDGQCLSRDQRELIGKTLATVDRVKVQIVELLRFAATIETGLERDDAVDLEQVILDVLDDLAAEIDLAEADIGVRSLPVILGNRAQLRVLLQNLIGNALKYRRSGVPAIIRVDSAEDNVSHELQVTIADNGIGIDKQHQELIFGMFKRLHRQSQIPGTGLGLAVCRRVARNLGGTLEVASVPNEGSVFILSIPGERIVSQRRHETWSRRTSLILRHA